MQLLLFAKVIDIYIFCDVKPQSCHLSKCHKEEIEEFENRERQAKQLRLPRTLAPSLDKAADKTHKISADQQQRVNTLLAQWIAAHFCPLVLVEDEGFLEFISYITQVLGQVDVRIPKRNQLRGYIIRLSSERRAEVQDGIEKHCLFFSFTSDIWTARSARSFISFPIHYVTENYQMRNWTLEVDELPEKHTGRVIQEKLEEVMNKWGLQKENCTRFVHDSSSNMVSAAELLEFHHTPCLAHELISKQTKSFETELPAWSTLVNAEVDALTTDHAGDDKLTTAERVEMKHLRDLAIDEMLDFTNDVLEDLEKDAMASMREKVQSFRSLSVYFRRSAKGHNCLADIQKKNGGTKAVNMIVDCPTRWNSCYDMLQRNLKLQGALDGFFQHLHTEEGRTEFKDMSKTLMKPIHKDWLAIDCLTVLLKPFASVSSMLGSQEYPTLPLVMSALDAIEDVLENPCLLESKLNGARSEEYAEEVRVLMSGVQSTVLRVFKKRFDKLKSTELDWIAFLDPRVAKTMNHVRPGKMKETQEKFLDAIMELADATVTPRSERRSRTPMNSPDPISDRMFGCRAPDDESPIERRCREEFANYLDAAKALVVPRQPQGFDIPRSTTASSRAIRIR